MRLTIHSDLAFRTLILLAAAREEGVDIPHIAKTYDVSENHLRKVAQRLAQFGWVTSTRGRGGGLRLAVEPDKIFIGEVLRRLETDFALVDCLGHAPERCVITGSCGLQNIFGEALRAWFKVLDQYTLADALSRSHGLEKALQLV
jgi:Rrf2 family transcriptional regulator, nitric oxide-sensitive transcriptional repressor